MVHHSQKVGPTIETPNCISFVEFQIADICGRSAAAFLALGAVYCFVTCSFIA